MGVTSSKSEPDKQTGAKTTDPPHKKSTSEPTAPITIPNRPELGQEAVRGKCVEPMTPGPSTPDSAKAGLSPSLPDNDASTAVPSAMDASQNLSRSRFDDRRFSRSSSAMLDIEVVSHPETGQPVFRRGSVHNKPALMIVDPSLIDVVLGDSGLGSAETTVYEGPILSTTSHIHEPYELLFYSRKKIHDATKTKSGHTPKHAQFLLDFMKNELNDTWDKCLDIERGICQGIAFEKLWLLYQPGETVYRKRAGGWRAYKVARVETGPLPVDPIRIFVYYLGFDKTGTCLVPQADVLTVDPYLSEQPVGNLDVVPEWYVKKCRSDLPQKLEKRGMVYWKYRGKPFYQEYRGDAWPTTFNKIPLKVIIDHATSSRHDVDASLSRSHAFSCPVCLAEAIKLGPWSGGSDGAPHDPDMCARESPSLQPSGTEIDRLVLYCPSMVWAFSLEHMTWEMVQLDALGDVTPCETGWDRLVMDGESRVQLDSMASGYFRDWTSKQELGGAWKPADNSLFGKRQGLNIHFHGGAGTGKTFAAECLAEKHGRPLYQIACGNLVTDPSRLELELRGTLLRAANWGAILLLEDADLFAQDCGHELQRNALMSILIHQLDLSDALVILATSHPSRHDKCFESRISLPLYFAPLNFGYQQKFWLDVLESLSSSLNLKLNAKSYLVCKYFIEKDLNGLHGGIHTQMNGRQIELCLRAALALARDRDGDGGGEINLKDDDIKKVLALGRDFRNRLKDTARFPNPKIQKREASG